MSIPFTAPDPSPADRDALLDLVRQVGMAPEQRFVDGEHTQALELRLRGLLGAADVVACASAGQALVLILRAMGVGCGDEVVVPAFGHAAPAAAVVELGATPVFADVDPVSLALDPARAEELITTRTRAVIPAHTLSVMADMPRFTDLAARYGFRLVEDATAAQGASLGGRSAGTWGEAGAVALGPLTGFGAAGEGGAVVTRYPVLGRAVRALRHGGTPPGGLRYGPRFDEVVAAFQVHRLDGLAVRLARRTRIADRYTERLAGLRDRGLLAPPLGDGRCPHVYAVLTEARDALQAHLAAHGIGSRAAHAVPLPRQAAFAPHVPGFRRWPQAERAARQVLALPVHPYLTDAQVEHIADTVNEFFRTRAVRHPAPSDAAGGSDTPAPAARPTDVPLPAGQTPAGQTPAGQTPGGQTPGGQTPGGRLPSAPAAARTGAVAGATGGGDGRPTR